ncbi:hypothetical protein Dsin_026785 [Dipteronia sinensis]|uniref:Uncharacterized protein n=1 Tax=Dipteronia sinensis TaxID=43782 RepID=A0AAD9ZYJ0_9ROSI|nr:hypothetical protein Dsin_026785 [Dipteronia sinensis]
MIASKSPPASADLFKDHPAVDKRENVEVNDFYDEVVYEMEEILLDYTESLGVRFSQGNQMLQSHLSLPLRDGGTTASTSGTDEAYPLTPLLLRIGGVEVVGAKQKKDEVERCKSCEAVFHKPCFRKISYCPCGATLGVDEAVNSTERVSLNANSGANRSLTLLGNRSGSGLSIGLFYGLFSKAKPEKAEHKDNDTVILMGSLPSTSL